MELPLRCEFTEVSGLESLSWAQSLHPTGKDEWRELIFTDIFSFQQRPCFLWSPREPMVTLQQEASRACWPKARPGLWLHLLFPALADGPCPKLDLLSLSMFHWRDRASAQSVKKGLLWPHQKCQEELTRYKNWGGGCSQEQLQKTMLQPCGLTWPCGGLPSHVLPLLCMRQELPALAPHFHWSVSETQPHINVLLKISIIWPTKAKAPSWLYKAHYTWFTKLPTLSLDPELHDLILFYFILFF